MRFRACLMDTGVLTRILSSLEKVDGKVVLHLQPEKFMFIARSDADLGIQAFAHLKSNCAFEEYTVESRADNNIYLRVGVTNMLRALKSAQTVTDIMMKLSRKDGKPYLMISFAKEGAAQTVEVVHDVPVRMMTREDMAAYAEPTMPPATVEIYLPTLKTFRAVIDRLKVMANQVVLHANTAGELTVAASIVGVEAKMAFSNLAMANQGEESQDGVTDTLDAEVKVDLKKLARILYGDRLQSTDVIACFHEGSALVLHFLHNDLFTSYYLPLVAIH